MPQSNALPHPLKGMIVIATLLVVVSARIFFGEVTQAGIVDSWATLWSSNPFLVTLLVVTGIAGIVTAAGLWRADCWALWAYLIWLALYFGAAVASERRFEPVIWKVLLASALASLLPALGAVYLFVAYKRLLGK